MVLLLFILYSMESKIIIRPA